MSTSTVNLGTAHRSDCTPGNCETQHAMLFDALQADLGCYRPASRLTTADSLWVCSSEGRHNDGDVLLYLEAKLARQRSLSMADRKELRRLTKLAG